MKRWERRALVALHDETAGLDRLKRIVVRGKAGRSSDLVVQKPLIKRRFWTPDELLNKAER